MMRIKPRHLAEAAKPQARVFAVALFICFIWVSCAATMH